MRSIREACTTVGFFQVVGHGVDPDVIDAAHALAVRMAALDHQQKAVLASPTGHRFRGLHIQRDAAGAVLWEQFQNSTFDDGAAAVEAGVAAEFADYFHANVWPADPAFRAAFEATAAQTRRLGHLVMRLFALALELPADTFEPAFSLEVTQVATTWYPPRPQIPDGRAAVLHIAHADSGVLTVLHQRGTYVGLEVETTDGDWVGVPVIEEAFVVNIGELMHRWTNGSWPATSHRVVSGPSATDHRQSLVTFLQPGVDTVVAPLPSTLGTVGPRYAPVRVYDWEAIYIREVLGERPPGHAPVTS